MHNRFEPAIDRAIHLAGLAAAVAGSAVLFWIAITDRSGPAIAGVALYSFGLLAMLTCSALYNGARSAKRRDLLQRFDHAAIFLMIAGTYSPLMIGALDDTLVAVVYVAVWAVAIFGFVAKLSVRMRSDRLSILLYIALGWAIVAAGPAMIEHLSLPVLWLVVAGGLLYTVGVLFHVAERLPYQNAIWHGFVIAAAGCHYAAILDHLTA